MAASKPPKDFLKLARKQGPFSKKRLQRFPQTSLPPKVASPFQAPEPQKGKKKKKQKRRKKKRRKKHGGQTTQRKKRNPHPKQRGCLAREKPREFSPARLAPPRIARRPSRLARSGPAGSSVGRFTLCFCVLLVVLVFSFFLRRGVFACLFVFACCLLVGCCFFPLFPLFLLLGREGGDCRFRGRLQGKRVRFL